MHQIDPDTWGIVPNTEMIGLPGEPAPATIYDATIEWARDTFLDPERTVQS